MLRNEIILSRTKHRSAQFFAAFDDDTSESLDRAEFFLDEDGISDANGLSDGELYSSYEPRERLLRREPDDDADDAGGGQVMGIISVR